MQLTGMDEEEENHATLEAKQLIWHIWT